MNIEIAQLKNNDAMLWKDAATFCETLEFDGKHDWRLPSVEELKQIYKELNGQYEDFFWTGDSQSYFLVWTTDMTSGMEKLQFKDYKNYVLPVRTKI